MKDKIEKIRLEIKEVLPKIDNLKQYNEVKIKYLGKKGIITELNTILKDGTKEEKKEWGKAINDLKQELNNNLEELKTCLEEKELEKRLQEEEIDITLPSATILNGAPQKD